MSKKAHKKITCSLEEEIVDGKIEYENLAYLASPSVLQTQISTIRKIQELLRNVEDKLGDGSLKESEIRNFLRKRQRPYINEDQPSYTRCLIYAGGIIELEKQLTLDEDDPLAVLSKGMLVQLKPENFRLIQDGIYTPDTKFVIKGFKFNGEECIQIEPQNDEYEEKIFISPQQIKCIC